MSGFTHPDDREKGRKRIRDATVFLEDELVPLVAKNLDGAHGGGVKRLGGRHFAKAMVERVEDVLLTLHRCGLNYQHLGLVRAKSEDENLRDLLLAEMIARVGKEDVREMWRDRGEGVKLPGRRVYTVGLVEVSREDEGEEECTQALTYQPYYLAVPEQTAGSPRQEGRGILGGSLTG